MKVLVLYVFHLYNERVEHFIQNAIFYDDNIDFIMISNDKNNIFEVPSYVKTFYRDNIGFDFGGWSEALLKDDLYKQYNQFIFVNSSVIGPYLSADYKGKWTDYYLNGLQDNVKLFGSTINVMGRDMKNTHVQSYIFSMEKDTLQFLINCEIFSTKNHTKTLQETIQKKEILMSVKLIQNGWNIGCLMPIYKNIDFTFKDKKPNQYPKNTFYNDPMYLQHRNKLWNEYEVIFIKGNRFSTKFT